MIRRASPLAFFSRTIAASTALVFAATACGHTILLTESALREKRQSRVDLVLYDGTELVVRGARLGDDDNIRGRVTDCTGTSCDQAGHDGGVALGAVNKMTTYVPDDGATTAWVVGTVLVIGSLTALAIGVAVASTTKPAPATTGNNLSCPRMYTWNGSDWQLDSGTFGGSLFATGQLTDHDLLEHLVPQDGKLRMRLVNELPETEYTDALALRVVDHPKGTRVVPTAAGKLLTFRDPAAPLAATDLRGKDALDVVSRRDEREWTSNLSNRNPERLEDARDGLVLDFAKPPGAKRAKLWVGARNTPWSSDMLEYLLSLLGPALPGWYASMNTDASARRAFSGFMEKEGSLVVNARTAGGAWASRGLFALAGPEILKDQALEIPVDDLPGDRLTLRLDAPVSFWSIDSVAVSFEGDEGLEVRDLSPVTAVADGGKDVLGALSAIDGSHYRAVTGNRAELSFDAPAAPKPGTSRSYVLVSTGYYVPDVPPAPAADPAEFLRVTANPDVASQQALAMLNIALARQLLR